MLTKLFELVLHKDSAYIICRISGGKTVSRPLCRCVFASRGCLWDGVAMVRSVGGVTGAAMMVLVIRTEDQASSEDPGAQSWLVGAG